MTSRFRVINGGQNGNVDQIGGGGDNGGMDDPWKIKVDERLGALERDAAAIRERLAGIDGRLQHMPTLWGIAGVMLGINAGIVAVSALLLKTIGR